MSNIYEDFSEKDLLTELAMNLVRKAKLDPEYAKAISNDSDIPIDELFSIIPDDRPSLDELMNEMHPDDRQNWCSAGAGGCMGCANGSGQLARYGYTKGEWRKWLIAHGEFKL
jgi:hypothetical protein